MEIKKLKKELGLSQADIAEFFQMSYGSFANSSAKERYETALCRFYDVVLERRKENKKDIQPNDGKP